MATLRISPTWLQEQRGAVNTGLPIDITSKHNLAIQELVIMLTKAMRPYKIFNLGAGVKRITTTTDICPCCKKPL